MDHRTSAHGPERRRPGGRGRDARRRPRPTRNHPSAPHVPGDDAQCVRHWGMHEQGGARSIHTGPPGGGTNPRGRPRGHHGARPRRVRECRVLRRRTHAGRQPGAAGRRDARAAFANGRTYPVAQRPERRAGRNRRVRIPGRLDPGMPPRFRRPRAGSDAGCDAHSHPEAGADCHPDAWGLQPRPISVTQADNGTTLHLAVGQQFLLDLGSSEDWTVTVANQDVVARVPGVLVVKGAQGLYAARAGGTTVLSAIGSPHCTSGVCPLFRIAFKITITVD